MLHRSFKPAKCKTAMKLAVSRIKLLKNKRAQHMVQLRREVAQLLESGQERTARIRVEHVVREEKTMAAYDLLEVYLELIVARLAMIESQKNCPIDLKEAVTSVIFASPRCADLPELQDIRKHLQSKYGKEFSTAAMELRPGCGVSRLMTEKLSVAAPDAQTKTKILAAIASEHNITWDPKASGENEEKPPEDLLNGPNTFLEASQKYEESPVQAPTISNQKRDAYRHENPSSPPVSQKFSSSATASTSQPLPGTPSVTAEEMGHRYTYSGDQKTYAASKQHWNMEFTDATSAAQAAAEAAERASMAARAAAELSSGERILRQQSSELQRPSVNDLRNASIDKHAVPTISNANVSKDPAKESHHGGDSRLESDKPFTKNSRQPHPRPDAAYQNEGLETVSAKSKMPPDHVFQKDGKGTDSKLDSSIGSDHFSSNSKRNFRDDVLGVQGTNANEQGNPLRVNESLNRPVHIRGSSRSDSLTSKTSFQEEEVFINSYSQENIFSNSDQAVKHEKNFAGEAGWKMGSSNYKITEAEEINYFADEIMNEKSNKGTSRSQSTKYESDHDDLLSDKFDNLEHSKFHVRSTEHETAVFDSSGSDDDVNKIDFTGGFKGDDRDPFKSPDQRSPIYGSPKRSSWFANDTSYDGFASKLIFADEESSSTKPSGDQSDIVGSSHSHESLPVAFDESDSEGELYRSDHGVSSTHESLSRLSGVSTWSDNGNCECVSTFPVFDDDELQHHISSHSVISDKESKPTSESPYRSRGETSVEQPSLDTGKELNLGLLSGGFRNKGIKSPPYIKSQAISLRADDIPVNDTSVSQTRTFADFEKSAKERLGGLQPSVRPDKESIPSFKGTGYDLEDDYSHPGDDKPQKSLQNEEGSTVQVSRPKSHLESGLSRRRKTSTSDGQRKPSRETYSTAYLSVTETQTTVQEEKSEVPRLTRPIPRKSAPEAKRRPNKPSSSNEPLEYTSNLTPTPGKGTASSSNPKAEQVATRQESMKKASHVHPKLPDFDTLTAHFSSLRTDSK